MKGEKNLFHMYIIALFYMNVEYRKLTFMDRQRDNLQANVQTNWLTETAAPSKHDRKGVFACLILLVGAVGENTNPLSISYNPIYARPDIKTRVDIERLCKCLIAIFATQSQIWYIGFSKTYEIMKPYLYPLLQFIVSKILKQKYASKGCVNVCLPFLRLSRNVLMDL